MKLKKYEARTEEEAVELVKAEHGPDALILSVRKVKSKGFLGIFQKPMIEVTSAYEEDEIKEDFKKELKYQREILDTEKSKMAIEKELKNRKINDQQATIDNLKSMVNDLSYKLSVAKYEGNTQRKYDSSILQAFFDTMVAQGVLPEIAEEILEEAMEMAESDNLNLSLVVKLAYNKILSILGYPEPIEINEDSKKAKIVFLMGPTGVGKTTTIAKLSANFILNNGYKVGLITSDTYRIAAVEQLKTYADILGVEVGVSYEEEEFKALLQTMSPIYDIICVDTAGRSHKNQRNFDDIKALVSNVPKENSLVYLVLSLTTKYEDLVDITNKFNEISDYRLIFTKWDETLSYGAILNICYKTGKKVDYLTLGQNVPSDIELMEPEILARALLGLGDME